MTYCFNLLKESIVYYIDSYNPASAGFFILKIWEPAYNSNKLLYRNLSNMLRTVIYMRKSSDEKTDKQIQSIERQWYDLERYIE